MHVKSRMKILIVEDSATLRHAMCRFITNAGHEPVIAKNGEEALQTFESLGVDMVIMDIEMPGLDGFETTRIMRDWMEQEDVWLPIIFVTGKHEEDDLRQGIEVGGDDYLIKPVSETILTAKIRAMERILAMREELKRLNESLTELSQKDGLTQLLNRRTFDERAESLWRQAVRNSEPLAILLLDIDFFKGFNDHYGHLAGDKCIQQVSRALETSLSRPSDLLARYGGEEFIVMLPNTEQEGAYHVAERLRRAVANLHVPHKESEAASYVTISIGGAVISHAPGTQLKDHIHAADLALYESKERGRNRVTVKLFSPRVRVLVADATGRLPHVVDGRLKQYFALLQSRTAQETLELALNKRPDAILLHENLSEKGGRDLALTLRQHGDTSLIPIVAICSTHREQWLREEHGIEADACFAEHESEVKLIDYLNKMLF